MEHLQRFLLIGQRIALGILLIFPLIPALLFQIYGFRSFPSSYHVFMLTPLFLVLVGYLVYLFINTKTTPDWLAVALVIAFALALRLAVSLVLSTDLASDTLDTHLFALDILAGNPTLNTEKYTYIPESTYLNMMGVTLAGIYALFGASLRIAKLVMVILNAFSCGLVYMVGKDVSRDHRVGLVAALLFAVWPSMVSYSAIPTAEHIAIFLIILYSFILEKFFSSKLAERWSWSLLMFAILGVLIGLIDWYRPVGLVLLLATLLALIFGRQQRLKLPFFISQIIVMSICYFLISGLSLTIAEKMHHLDLPSSSQRLGETILIGTNLEKKGAHNHPDHATIIAAYKRYYGNYDAANNYLLHLAFERVVQNSSQIPGLLKDKFERLWANDEQLFFFALVGSNDQELVGYLKILNQFFLVFLTILVIISTISSIIRPSHSQVFLMQLFIVGISLLLLITEVQNRYRTVLTPYLVILAAIGAKEALSFLNIQRLRRFSNHRENPVAEVDYRPDNFLKN